MSVPNENGTAQLEDSKQPWYKGISRYAWIVLIVAILGWMFDTFDQQLFNLVRQSSLKDILKPTMPGATDKVLTDAANKWGGYLTAIFLIGWAIGGFVFGILGDKIGRTKTMIITICIYALFTGLNGLVQDPWMYALCRFLTALGVGGEFAAGTALVAETWPNRSRPMALGTLQAFSAVGNICAAAVTMLLSSLGWRWVYAVGILPALLVLWIRSSVKEPEKWKQAKEQSAVSGADKEFGNITTLFTDPTLRRNTIAGILLALAGVAGVWGIGFFLPDFMNQLLRPIFLQLPAYSGLEGDAQTKAVNAALQFTRSRIFMVQQVGAFLGMFAYAVLSQKIGRRPALGLFFILAFASVQAAFWNIRDETSAYVLAFFMGFCTLAPFSAFAIYFPELFPTRLRATGIGVCYNCARILAAGAPILLGNLAIQFSKPDDPTFGFRMAAGVVASVYTFGLIGLIFAPETKGKPLPE